MADAELLSEIRSLRLIKVVKQLISQKLQSECDPDEIMGLPMINLLRFINDPTLNLKHDIRMLIDERKAPIQLESLPAEIQVHILRLVSTTARECVLVSKKMRILADLALRKNIKYGPLISPVASDNIEILKNFFEYERGELLYTRPGLYYELRFITKLLKFTDPVAKITKLSRDMTFSRVDPKFYGLNTNYFVVYGISGSGKKHLGIFKFSDIVCDADGTKLALMPAITKPYGSSDSQVRIINITIMLSACHKHADMSTSSRFTGNLCVAVVDTETSTMVTGRTTIEQITGFLKPLQHTDVINSKIILPNIKTGVSIL